MFWFTIAYCIVVSICECPSIFCTCSMGIPLSIALVAMDLRNLCGWIRSSCSFLPRLRSRISTPLIFNRSYGASNVTNKALLSSFLCSMYSSDELLPLHQNKLFVPYLLFRRQYILFLPDRYHPHSDLPVHRLGFP